jgi:hypothetical protein
MSLWFDEEEKKHIKKLMEQLQQLCPGWKSVGIILSYFELYKTIPKATQNLVSIYKDRSKNGTREQLACYQ